MDALDLGWPVGQQFDQGAGLQRFKMGQGIVLARLMQAGVVPIDTGAALSGLHETGNRDDAKRRAPSYTSLFPNYRLLIENRKQPDCARQHGKFDSYGGVSGGLRATQIERLHVTSVKMMPMMESVTIPRVASHINDGGVSGSNALIDASARTLLDELLRWTEALETMRA